MHAHLNHTYLVLHDEFECAATGFVEDVAHALVVIVDELLLLLIGELHVGCQDDWGGPHVAQPCRLCEDALNIQHTHNQATAGMPRWQCPPLLQKQKQGGT